MTPVHPPKRSRRKRRSPLVWLVLLMLAAIPAGLALSRPPVRLGLWTLLGQPISIQTAQQSLDALGSTVILEGTVRDRVPLVDAQVYQLQDASGSLWVVSGNTGLQVGETVRIRGKLRFQSIPVEGQELGELYVEQE